jgi:hypothetical protein
MRDGRPSPGARHAARFPPPNGSPLATRRQAVSHRSAGYVREAERTRAVASVHFSRAFKRSLMQRATRRGLKRHAAVVLGNVGSPEDIDVLARALVWTASAALSLPSASARCR